MARGDDKLTKQKYCQSVQYVCKDLVNYWGTVSGFEEEEDYDYN